MYKNIKYSRLTDSPRVGKKKRMIFYDKDKILVSYTDFGADGMSDFTIHKDEDRKDRWLNRFNKLINKYKSDPTKATTLSHMIFWNRDTLEDSYKNYLNKFNLKNI
jgi:Holliday junction resolvasome RuvABC ATP-dependent DNA helicase subunit